MNKCLENDVQEMLPDLLHRSLPADAQARVEAHLATCEECREELAVLRTVKSAAVFAPAINVDQVVRQIPPYQKIVPAVERPATTRMVSWLVAASLAIAVVGGGSLVLSRPDVATDRPIAVVPSTSVPNQAQPTPEPSAPVNTVSPSRTTVASAQPHAHALALAADVGGLTDGNLEQLMTEMAQFDALPATEGDPVMLVDTSNSLDQD